MSQGYIGSILVGFSVIQKITWFSHYLHLFPNKILIEKELALEFKKTDTYGSALITHYPNDHTGINANWKLWLAQVATIFFTQIFYTIRSIQKFT